MKNTDSEIHYYVIFSSFLLLYLSCRYIFW